MFTAVLITHSLLRWVLLAALLGWVGRAFTRGPWTPLDRRLGLVSLIATDTQLLLGLLLWGVFSPTVEHARADVGAAMKDDALRFWLVEHGFGMIVGVVFVHLAWALAKRASDDATKRRRVAVFGVLALLAFVGSMPHFFRAAVERPLLPF